jgi:hypothetical protein
LFDEAADRPVVEAADGVGRLSGASSKGADLEVVNTVASPRGGLVLLTRWQSGVGDRVTGSRGRTLPSQRLADGTLAVAVADVPPLGGERLRVERGEAAIPVERVTASGTTLESAAIRVELDPTTGAIRRLLTG